MTARTSVWAGPAENLALVWDRWPYGGYPSSAAVFAEDLIELMQQEVHRQTGQRLTIFERFSDVIAGSIEGFTATELAWKLSCPECFGLHTSLTEEAIASASSMLAGMLPVEPALVKPLMRIIGWRVCAGHDVAQIQRACANVQNSRGKRPFAKISEQNVTQVVNAFSSCSTGFTRCSFCTGASPAPSREKPRETALLSPEAAAVPAEVLHVACAVRAALDARAREEPDWSPDLAGACDVGSAALARILRARGWRAAFVVGTYRGNGLPADHCWVQLDQAAQPSAVIDVTATQFGLAQVHVQALTSAYALEEQGRRAHTHVRFLWWSKTRGQARDRAIQRIVDRAQRLMNPLLRA